MSRFIWRNRLAIAVALGVLAGARSLSAQDDKAAKSPAPVVAATINGEPVYVGEVDAAMSDVTKRRQINPQGIDHARAGLLRQIIMRRLAELALERDETYVNPSMVDKELAKIAASLKTNGTTLEDFAARRGVGPEVARREVAWQLGWNKYLERNLADALEGYFTEHHKDLDGTEVRASHILLRPLRGGEPQSQLTARAEKIRDEIRSGKITFAQAAEKYSAGPSRHHGGDMGFFPRYDVMIDEFSKAAFALQPGELSKPVVTAFGTHLITVTDVKPGKKQWTEVVPKIKEPAAADLRQKLADKERESAKIEFTGKAPYFKAATNELVLPGGVAHK
jgi:parvulin-like peptidyl-prolyl isomerase